MNNTFVTVFVNLC